MDKILSHVFYTILGVAAGIVDYILTRTIPFIIAIIGVSIIAAVTGVLHLLLGDLGVTQRQVASVAGASVIIIFFISGIKFFIWTDSIMDSGKKQYHFEVPDSTVIEIMTELDALQQSLSEIRSQQRQLESAAWAENTEDVRKSLNALADEWETVEIHANSISDGISDVSNNASLTDDRITTKWGKIRTHWNTLGPDTEQPLITVPLPHLQTIDDLDTATLTIVAWSQDRAQFREDLYIVTRDDPDTIIEAIKYGYSPDRISRAVAANQNSK